MSDTAPKHIHSGSSPRAAVVVAHPDDETLWAGGLILSLTWYDWFIASLCRASDPDRSPKFSSILRCYQARGAMADLDDGPDQSPLSAGLVEREILRLLPGRAYDLIVTHAPRGEYTRHRRHEEVSRAVTSLWESGRIEARNLYLFAYDDSRGVHLPRAIPAANRIMALPQQLQAEKYRLITQVYGFAPASWEARTSPTTEAFWCFESPAEYHAWLAGPGAQT